MTEKLELPPALREPEPPSGAMAGVLQSTLVVVVVVATLAGALFASSNGPKVILLPVAAVLALLMAVLAYRKFAVFVLLILAARSSLDAIHSIGGSASAAGDTGALGGAASPSSAVAALFLLGSLLWLAARQYSGERVNASPLTVWLALFWITGVASLSDSLHVQQGLLECLRIGSAVMMFVVLEQLIDSPHMMRRVMLAAYLSMLIPLGYTLFGMLLGHPVSEEKHGLTRIIGTFTQSNGFARYLAFMIIFGMAIYPYIERRARLALGVILGLSGVFLILTLTIGAMIGTVVGLVIVGIVQRRRVLLMSVVATAAVVALTAPGLSGRVDTLQPQQAGASTSTNSLVWRIGYWTNVLPLANSNPVTGIGLDSTVAETDAEKQPHNDFVRAYVETGVLGLIAYVGMLVVLIRHCRHAVRRSVKRTLDHGVASGALACAVCFVVESLAANVITDLVNVWYLLAFAACAGYVARKHAGRQGLSEYPIASAFAK